MLRKHLIQHSVEPRYTATNIGGVQLKRQNRIIPTYFCSLRHDIFP